MYTYRLLKPTSCMTLLRCQDQRIWLLMWTLPILNTVVERMVQCLLYSRKYLNRFFPIVHKVYSNLEFYALAVEEQRWRRKITFLMMNVLFFSVFSENIWSCDTEQFPEWNGDRSQATGTVSLLLIYHIHVLWFH